MSRRVCSGRLSPALSILAGLRAPFDWNCMKSTMWPSSYPISFGDRQGAVRLAGLLFQARCDFQCATRGVLVAALATGTTSAFPTALEDRMHQPYRADLVPGLEEALRLRAPGLLGCALSGAGPSIVVFYEKRLRGSLQPRLPDLRATRT